MISRYLTGFLLSLTLTLVSFGVVWLHQFNGHSWPTHQQILMVVVAMAVAQLLVQFSYFLEIGRRSGAWRLITLALAVTTAVIVFGGSLWIMANLGHTPPNERFNGTPSPQSQVD